MQQHNQSQSVAANPPLANQPVNPNTNVLMGAFAIALLLLLVSTITVHRKRRAARLRQQIEMLEKLWRLDYKKKAS